MYSSIVRDKFGCDSAEPVRLVLEADGTQVDDDEHLRWLPDSTVFLLLRNGQHWRDDRAGAGRVSNDHATHPDVAATTAPIPRVVCDALNLLEIYQEPPFWKIIDNRGRVTLVLHWEHAGPRSDRIHYIEPSRPGNLVDSSMAPVPSPAPIPGPGLGPGPGSVHAAVPRSFADIKISSFPDPESFHSTNEGVVTVVTGDSGCADFDAVATLRGGQKGGAVASHAKHAPAKPCAGAKDRRVASRDRGEGVNASAVPASCGTLRAHRVAATVNVPTSQLAASATSIAGIATPATTAPTPTPTPTHSHHAATGDDCEFHCGSLHEEGRIIRGADARSSSHRSASVGASKASPHVRFKETLDSRKKEGLESAVAVANSKHVAASSAAGRQVSAGDDSSDSECEPESNCTVEEEQENGGSVTTEKVLLLTDQLSTDQRKHLTILDLGVILERLKAKIIDVERLEREREGPGCYRWTIKATIRGNVLRDMGVLYNGNYYSISEHPGLSASAFDFDEEDREDPV